MVTSDISQNDTLLTFVLLQTQCQFGETKPKGVYSRTVTNDVSLVINGKKSLMEDIGEGFGWTLDGH